MSDRVTFTIDGQTIEAFRSQSIMDAAMEAGVYIPRLCHVPGLDAWGSCRVCTVKVNGRPCAACIQPAMEGITVENDTEELNAWRKDIVEMLFVGGNHFCMFCEKSGNCELQAMGYKLGVTAPTHPYLNPERPVDASHPDILLDHNRCILCARCVRTSRDLDGKEVFHFVNRGGERRIAIDPGARLKDSEADVTDRALDACPVGALLRKRAAFRVPVGEREYDHVPIGEEDRTNPVSVTWPEAEAKEGSHV